MLKSEPPDVVHIFGRLRHDAWRKFPLERTIFHEMMTGTIDGSWTDDELAEFRWFAERVARYFAPGSGVAANVRSEFKVQRRLDTIFTMVPDEVPTGTSPVLPKSIPPFGDKIEPPNCVRRLRFGVLCRLKPQKGIRYLLEALKQYRERHGFVDFTFAGFGPLEETIREFASTHALCDVRVTPVKSALATLSEIDVFVHPSIDDAMPVAIGEALMLGTPCVVCRVGGVPDLVRDGKEGVVIEPHTVEPIVEGMEQFARMSDSEFAAFRSRARARYESVCLPESVGRSVAKHYRDILGT